MAPAVTEGTMPPSDEGADRPEALRADNGRSGEMDRNEGLKAAKPTAGVGK